MLRSSSRHRWLWPVGAFCLASALLSALLPTERSALASTLAADHLVGSYRFVGGQREVRQVERAIDEVVAEMSFFIRGMASRRLKALNLPADELRIFTEGVNITVGRSGQPDISAPADGSPITWRNPDNGNVLKVTHRVYPDGTLKQRLVGDRGVSENVFDLNDNGRLTMSTSIEAEKLPSHIRFATTYVRRDR
jgi:hypothetical protein